MSSSGRARWRPGLQSVSEREQRTMSVSRSSHHQEFIADRRKAKRLFLWWQYQRQSRFFVNVRIKNRDWKTSIKKPWIRWIIFISPPSSNSRNPIHPAHSPRSLIHRSTQSFPKNQLLKFSHYPGCLQLCFLSCSLSVSYLHPKPWLWVLVQTRSSAALALPPQSQIPVSLS